MGKITILEETTKNPITLMGKRAGVCWGADITDDAKNYKRGLDCLVSGHGRVMEYVNVEMVLDGYSARVIREWYTHLAEHRPDFRRARDILIMRILGISYRLRLRLMRRRRAGIMR